MPRRARKGTHITEERRHRMAKALEYRKQGRSYQKIAEALGISLSQAERDVKDALNEITREPAEEVLAMELQRLDTRELQLNAEVARCLREMNEHGSDVKWSDLLRKHTETLLRVSMQRARLTGLDNGIHVDASIDVEETVQAMFTQIMQADPEELGGE